MINHIHVITCLLVYGFIHEQSLLYDLVCLLLRVCVCLVCVCVVSVLCVCVCARISMYILHIIYIYVYIYIIYIYMYYITIYAHHRLTVFLAFWLFIISGIRLWRRCLLSLFAFTSLALPLLLLPGIIIIQHDRTSSHIIAHHQASSSYSIIHRQTTSYIHTPTSVV